MFHQKPTQSLQSIKDYNAVTAKHYAAYRPPLHEMILALALPEGLRYETGLDIGSGTGYSSLALAAYCRSVIGIEPSDAMRTAATPHPKVEYREGSGEFIPVEQSSVDIATFAGSLFYTDKGALIPELARVCRNGCKIVVYDFEVLVDNILTDLHVPLTPHGSDYDHAVNLSGIDGLSELTVCRDQRKLLLEPAQLAHVLLSSPDRYLAIAEKYKCDNPFDSLVSSLSQPGKNSSLSADIFYSIYHLNK